MNEELNRLFEQSKTSDSSILKETTKLADLEDGEFKNFLIQMYLSKDRYRVRVASILNAIYTERNFTFFLSKESCEKLIKNDENSNYVSINSKMYKFLIAKSITELGWFKRLREPTTNKAGVYVLANQTLLKYLIRDETQEDIEKQQVTVLGEYDGFIDLNEATNKTQLESTEKREKFVLKRTMKLEEIDSEVLKSKLNQLYSSSEPLDNVLGTIINSLFSHDLKTFILDVDDLRSLVRNDENLRFRYCRFSDIADLFKNYSQYFKELGKPKLNFGGLYSLIHKELNDELEYIHGKAYYELKKQLFLEKYDRGDFDNEMEKYC